MRAKLRTADVCDAIGVTAKQFQQWLERELVEPEGGFGRGWAEYTLRDVAVLAITKALIEFNVPIRAAFEAAHHAINLGYKDVRQKHFTRPGEQYYAGWENAHMTMRRDSKKPKEWKVARWQGREGEMAFGNFIVIDVYSVVSTAVQCAVKRLEAKEGTAEQSSDKARAGG